jgi:hypothetical protein
MPGRNFIDWNGSGGLDLQDLVTGVAMDVVEQEEEHEQYKKPAPSAGGCMLTAFMMTTLVLITSVAVLEILL